MAKKRKGIYARDIDRLNMWFALVALASMLTVVWMIWDDYAAPWKPYQRQFRQIEREVTEQQLADEQGAIDQALLTEVREQRDAAEQALSEQQDVIGQIDSDLESAQTKLDLADQNLRFARSAFDSYRWAFEEARKKEGEEAAAAERANMEGAQADLATFSAEVEVLTIERDAHQARLEEITAARDQAQSEISAMNREIDRLRGRLDALRFDWVYSLRNAPFLDGLNPSLRINQVVLENIRFDLNFTDAPQVDRCETCHLGARSAEYETYEQPFTSHPQLDLFVGDNSIHPASEFGWEHIEQWEWPMRANGEIESGCVKCHLKDTWLPDAPKLEYGLELIEKLGCYGCHELDRWEEARNRGPNLSHLVSKIDAAWAYNWVINPKSFRPETPMPRFFNLANTSDAYWRERNQVEVEAIVSYLFEVATPIELDSAPGGDAAAGEQLFDSVGCLGCHMIGEFEAGDELEPDAARFAGLRHHGPDLSALGSKVTADWLYTWIRNPSHYWDETVMPSLRLSRTEAADITAFLMGQTDPDWDDVSMPVLDPAIRDEVALEYLKQQLPAADAEERLAAMSKANKLQYLGERLISRYGCMGCHTIPGFENAGRIGTSLSNWGSKPITRLDFGLQDLPHERRAFLVEKLRRPRIFDQGRVRTHQALLKMPSYDLEPAEIEAIATAILGFTDQEMLPAAMPSPTPRHETIAAGRAIVDKFNCRGCHIIEDRGGAIRNVIAESMLATGEVSSRSAGLVFGPPNLKSEGARTQPDWLYRFFRAPSIVRPWLKVRMPTFSFTDEQLNALTAYFSALDEAPYPFEETFTTAHEYPQDLVREGAILASDQEGSLQCLACHFQGSRQPRVPPTQWAPDLALAANRLRAEWIDQWIKDPQSLQPGTNMPQFYSNLQPGSGYWAALGNDPQKEISALVAYLMSIGT